MIKIIYENAGSKYQWKPISSSEKNFVYSDSKNDEKLGCIGHLRGDFGDGNEFWTTWWDHVKELKTNEFKSELGRVVGDLRENILKNRKSMYNECKNGTMIENNTYGFKMETDTTTYYLRCYPYQGDYNFYLYCYSKN